MAFDAATVAATAVVVGSIDLVFWLLIKRQFERVDSLENRLRSIEENRLRNIEQHLAETVTKSDCLRQHEAAEKVAAEATERIWNSALTLKEVSTQTERAIKWLGENTKDLIQVKTDIATLAAKVENIERSQHGRRGA